MFRKYLLATVFLCILFTITFGITLSNMNAELNKCNKKAKELTVVISKQQKIIDSLISESSRYEDLYFRYEMALKVLEKEDPKSAQSFLHIISSK